MEGPVYLDYNATTPVDPEVVDAMLPFLTEHFGNASSSHEYGQDAYEAMERARMQVATFIGARPDEIVFTGGGSETDNLAIKGVVFQHLKHSPHILSTTVEHPAVLNTLAYLRGRFGATVTLLPVDEYGLIEPSAVRDAIRPETVLVTIMHANNEVGTMQPVSEIAQIIEGAGALFHIDAAQSIGKCEVRVDDLGVDLMTIAAHKVYAPKGIGALYVRRGVQLDPLVHGSGQESGRRAGTQNVAGIVALGKACEIAGREIGREAQRLRGLRDSLFSHLQAQIPGLRINGHLEHRLPNTLNVSFPGVIGQAMLDVTPDVAASTGSACHSGQTDPSSVLMAMGLGEERSLGAVRFSLGRWTTESDVDRAASALLAGYEEARRFSAVTASR